MTEEELLSYLGKDIEVTYNDGYLLVGHAFGFEWGVDEYPSCLSIYQNFNRGYFVDVCPDEVKSIKIINKATYPMERIYSQKPPKDTSMSDAELEKFVDKDVKVTLKHGYEFTGHVCELIRPDYAQHALEIQPFEPQSYVKEIDADRIASIEIIDSPKK